MFFKRRNSKISTRGVTVNGVSLNVVETAVHLGHHISTRDKECTVNAAKNNLWIYLIMVISTLCLNELFRQYCCSYYGSPLWPLQSDEVEFLCVAWRKALRVIWRVHPQTHCDVSSRRSETINIEFKG